MQLSGALPARQTLKKLDARTSHFEAGVLMSDHIANVEQAEEWDGREGDHWVQHADRYDALSQRITPHLMQRAAIGTADQVLDVGCGCGLTTRSAARAASSGSALGIDLSAAMLQEAERRARAEGLSNVRFEQGDVQVYAFPSAGFDLAMSRFGVMFFEDPVAGFGNIGSALRTSGRLVFLCWQDLALNEWIMVPAGGALSFVPFPDLGPEGAPGPFSLAEADRIRWIMVEAGFDGIEINDIREQMFLGNDAVDATDFLRGTGMARLLFEGVDAETERKAIDAVRGVLELHEQPDGIWLGSAAWLVSARCA
jgi:SAM-dependent methyltransferase